MSSFFEKYWLIVAAVLIISLIAGGVSLAIRLAHFQPVEISLKDARAAAVTGDIYIDGAVHRPGLYPAKYDDTITTAIGAAGISDNADLGKIKIHVPLKDEAMQPQKVNLNRAEPWLLQALPGIGEGRAKAITDYRSKNGPFRNIDDLLKIQGFGNSVVDKIRDFACIED